MFASILNIQKGVPKILIIILNKMHMDMRWFLVGDICWLDNTWEQHIMHSSDGYPIWVVPKKAKK